MQKAWILTSDIQQITGFSNFSTKKFHEIGYTVFFLSMPYNALKFRALYDIF